MIWYWEFDREKQYFHKFRTIDYVAALESYTANKFSMWDEEDQKEAAGRNDRE